MGLNAYFAYVVVLQMGYTWQAALGAVFISGLLFMVLVQVAEGDEGRRARRHHAGALQRDDRQEQPDADRPTWWCSRWATPGRRRSVRCSSPACSSWSSR
jgi:hypothetical protein